MVTSLLVWRSLGPFSPHMDGVGGGESPPPIGRQAKPLRGEVTGLRSHSQKGAELGAEIIAQDQSLCSSLIPELFSALEAPEGDGAGITQPEPSKLVWSSHPSPLGPC